MGDKIELVEQMEKLKALNTQLVELCAQQKPAFIGFDIERITIEMEKDVLRNGVKTLNVNTLDDWTQLYKVLESWGRFYKSADHSTKFVDRLPGIVVITDNITNIKMLVDNINLLKKEIAHTVRENRDPYQRHQFIHDTFQGIMTEQVYRDIRYFDNNVTNVWFNWASRPVPKSFTIKEAQQMLDEQLKRPKYLMSDQEWTKMIHHVKSEISTGNFSSIQQMKEFRVLPTIEMQHISKLGIKKRAKHNATTPWILLGQEKNELPKFSTLKPYVNNKADQSIKVRPNKVLLNPYLKLVGVKKTK